MRTVPTGSEGDETAIQPAAAVRVPAVQQRPLCIVADDLTGACDSAVAFASDGLEVAISIDADAIANPNEAVRAINTESRDLVESLALARLRESAVGMDDAEVFKKVDSVFRGNTFAEIQTSLEVFEYDLAVIAPAYPALGRTVLGGRLLTETSPPLDLYAALSLAGCRPVRASQTLRQVTAIMVDAMRACPADSHPVVLCDALTQDDLQTTVSAARSLQGRILWIGSGGLALALAGSRAGVVAALPAPPRRGASIFFIGSDHPATAAQVTHLHQETGLALVQGASDLAQRGADLLVRVPRGQISEQEVREAVQHLEPADTACLFMTGGDTALHVCRALGIHTLRLQREFAPGVPLAHAAGGRFHGVPVLLKSGGFGDHDLLLRILKHFTPHPATPRMEVTTHAPA